MCTGVRFVDGSNNLYIGRNLDVPATYGQKVVMVPRNYDISMKHESTITTTKAMIGMGITVGDYPLFFDAASENGLAILTLNFRSHLMDGKIVEGMDFAYYTDDVVEGKTNVTNFEFLPWILQNFDSVDEILAWDLEKNLNFVDTPFNEEMANGRDHWLISDNKQSIVVEPLRAGVKVYHNPVGVLTNDPTFDWHLTYLNQYLGLRPEGREPVKWGTKQLHYLGVGTGTIGMPGDWTPPSRFVKVAYVNNFYPQKEGETANVARMFNTLKSVAMPEGSVGGEITIYSSCYSQATQTYYYDTSDDFQVHAHQMTEANKTASTLTIF